MEVVGHLLWIETAQGKLSHGKGKQPHVVRLEVNFSPRPQHLPVAQQEIPVGQPPLGVALGGPGVAEVNVDEVHLIRGALRDIGYDENYAARWGKYAIDVRKVEIINLIGQQSADIKQGIEQNGWGDQGIFVGYACQGEDFISREMFLARKLNRALYQKARQSKNLGIDIKTQITLDACGNVETAIAAVPMLEYEDLTDFIIETLNEKPKNIIINGTGTYQYHSSIADCGVTGRKLACDFYGVTCPIGGGSPWAKDASKADVGLNALVFDVSSV